MAFGRIHARQRDSVRVRVRVRVHVHVRACAHLHVNAYVHARTRVPRIARLVADIQLLEEERPPEVRCVTIYTSVKTYFLRAESDEESVAWGQVTLSS